MHYPNLNTPRLRRIRIALNLHHYAAHMLLGCGAHLPNAPIRPQGSLARSLADSHAQQTHTQSVCTHICIYYVHHVIVYVTLWRMTVAGATDARPGSGCLMVRNGCVHIAACDVMCPGASQRCARTYKFNESSNIRKHTRWPDRPSRPTLLSASSHAGARVMRLASHASACQACICGGGNHVCAVST